MQKPLFKLLLLPAFTEPSIPPPQKKGLLHNTPGPLIIVPQTSRRSTCRKLDGITKGDSFLTVSPLLGVTSPIQHGTEMAKAFLVILEFPLRSSEGPTNYVGLTRPLEYRARS